MIEIKLEVYGSCKRVSRSLCRVFCATVCLPPLAVPLFSLKQGLSGSNKSCPRVEDPHGATMEDEVGRARVVTEATVEKRWEPAR
jgi:hypothetical protein